MPKKNRARPRPKAAAPRKRSCVLALVLIDEEPIRRAALADYRVLEGEAARLREQLEQFETVDCPAYARWDAQTFGPLLTELRDLNLALGEKRRVLDAIDDEMLWSGCSERVAYRRVMTALEEPPPESGAEEDFGHAGEGADTDFSGGKGEGMFDGRDLPPGVTAASFDTMSAPEQRQFRAFFAGMAELFSKMTGQPAPSLEEALARDRARHGGEAPRRGSAPAESALKPGADRIKELYRKIVRQLHPDANGEFAPRERELWHELQAAYSARNLDRLEAVAARVALGGGAGGAAGTPVGVLLRITREMRAAVESFGRQIGAARKDPAWHFSAQPGAQRPLEKRRRTQLARALAQGRYYLARATAVLEELARKASPATRKKPRANPVRRRWTQPSDQAELF